MMLHKVGYARVSTEAQDLTAQKGVCCIKLVRVELPLQLLPLRGFGKEFGNEGNLVCNSSAAVFELALADRAESFDRGDGRLGCGHGLETAHRA